MTGERGTQTFLRRQILSFAAVTPFVWSGRGVLAKTSPGQFRPLHVFRLMADKTDTPAFRRAVGAGAAIYLPAGKGLGENGAYIVDEIELNSNSHILGDGDRTRVVADADGSGTCFIIKGNGQGAYVENVSLRHFSIAGLCKSRGFSEHIHLLNFSGVMDLAIEQISFSQMQGDAIYIGAGYMDALQLHNEGVSIRDCQFDGSERSNRNAISIVSGEDVEIIGCRFAACSRLDMPGPVDFEANSPGQDRFGNIRIENCIFKDCGGSAGQISFISAAARGNAQGRFLIANNRFANYLGSGADILIDIQTNTYSGSTPAKVMITGNRGKQGLRPVWLKSGNVVKSSANIWTNYAKPMIVGTARGETVKTVIIADVFDGKDSQAAVPGFVDIYDVSDLDLRGSRFLNCNPTIGAPITMTDGTAQLVDVSMRSFKNCRSRGTPVFSRQRSHKTAKIRVDGRTRTRAVDNILID